MEIVNNMFRDLASPCHSQDHFSDQRLFEIIFIVDNTVARDANLGRLAMAR